MVQASSLPEPRDHTAPAFLRSLVSIGQPVWSLLPVIHHVRGQGAVPVEQAVSPTRVSQGCTRPKKQVTLLTVGDPRTSTMSCFPDVGQGPESHSTNERYIAPGGPLLDILAR